MMYRQYRIQASIRSYELCRARRSKASIEFAAAPDAASNGLDFARIPSNFSRRRGGFQAASTIAASNTV